MTKGAGKHGRRIRTLTNVKRHATLYSFLQNNLLKTAMLFLRLYLYCFFFYNTSLYDIKLTLNNRTR